MYFQNKEKCNLFKLVYKNGRIVAKEIYKTWIIHLSAKMERLLESLLQAMVSALPLPVLLLLGVLRLFSMI